MGIALDVSHDSCDTTVVVVAVAPLPSVKTCGVRGRDAGHEGEKSPRSCWLPSRTDQCPHGDRVDLLERLKTPSANLNTTPLSLGPVLPLHLQFSLVFLHFLQCPDHGYRLLFRVHPSPSTQLQIGASTSFHTILTTRNEIKQLCI
jgi:hypothetical protein